MQMIPLTALTESPTNPRKHFDSDSLDKLAESIKAHGVLQPILVRPRPGSLVIDGEWECVYGHRRLRATRQAGLMEIPAQVRKMSDEEVLEVQLIENLDRDDLHPLEEADAYAMVVDAGVLTLDDLVIRIGRSKSHIYGRVRLAGLGTAAREAFLADELTASIAMLLTRVHPDRQDAATAHLLARQAKRAEWGGAALTTDDAVAELRTYTHSLREAPFNIKDTELCPAAGACTECPLRSGEQPDLFGGLDPDDEEMCTEPKCYADKLEANWNQHVARAHRGKREVLESAAVFASSGKVKRSHVDMAARPLVNHYGTDGYDDRTWKKMLGRGVKPAIARHPITGQVVEVLPAKDAKAALPEKLRKAMDPKQRKSPTVQLRPGYAEVREETDRRLMTRMCQVLTMDDSDFIKMLAAHLAQITTEIPNSLGWIERDASYWAQLSPEDQEAVKARLKTMTPTEARAIIFFDVSRENPTDRTNAFADLELGAEGIQAEVEKELTAKLKAKAKAEAKAKKAAKKP